MVYSPTYRGIADNQMKRNTLIIFLFIACIMVTIPCFGTQLNIQLSPEENAWLKNHSSINIGGPKSFPPFHFFDDKNDLKGISADYITMIMNSLGVKVNVLNNLPWPEVLKKAASGEIDLIPCIAKTEEQEAFLDFSHPYLSFPLVIITRKDTQFIRGIEDLTGRKLAIIQKISTDEWLKRDGIDFIPYLEPAA